ncbi:MAG: transporter [Microbacteriaceae bacterium]|nr:transporter [Microbacteriaceae bacterium]
MITSTLARGARQILMLGWTLLALVPFALIILLAFRNNTDIYRYPLGVGGTYHPENFVTAWSGPVGSAGMGTFLANSIFAFIAALIVNVVLGSVAAYFVTRLPQRVTTIYLGIFVAGTVVPFVLLLVPYYRLLNSLQMLSNPWALGVLYGVLALPTTVLVLNAYFVDFPRELVEAAYIDGLGDLAVFMRVVIPLSKGAITAVSLLLAIWVWSETQLAIVLLQDSGSQTAAVGILGFQGQFTTNLGALFAGLTIIAIPVVALYLVFHRYITKGIALGGVFR